MDLPRTLGQLRRAKHHPPRTVKEELRANVAARLRAGATPADLFPGLLGYADTVLPQVVNALLAGHDLLLLGLRGQAKTRLARAIAALLDEHSPALAGDPLRSHPLRPAGPTALEIHARHGDDAPLIWLDRHERYGEKLATPDVQVADLIGDIDPIRAHRDGRDLGDHGAITWGLIPRANRGVFCLNELPDLAPRIQVALFNILEEHDVQVRGIPLRLPLDLLLVATANPEDYTARGRIVTPLKDRIGAQILTHYPHTRAEGVAVLAQEAASPEADGVAPVLDPLFAELIEESVRAARGSEYVDQKSGVSVRAAIAALEAVRANVLARGLMTDDAAPRARLVDLAAAVPALTGKLELAYEGEEQGAARVAWHVLGQAVRALWAEWQLPTVIDPATDEREAGPFGALLRWFAAGNRIALDDRMPAQEHVRALRAVPGLEALAGKLLPQLDAVLAMEFLVEGLYQGGGLARTDSARGLTYSDLLATMLTRSDKKQRRAAE